MGSTDGGEQVTVPQGGRSVLARGGEGGRGAACVGGVRGEGEVEGYWSADGHACDDASSTMPSSSARYSSASSAPASSTRENETVSLSSASPPPHARSSTWARAHQEHAHLELDPDSLLTASSFAHTYAKSTSSLSSTPTRHSPPPPRTPPPLLPAPAPGSQLPPPHVATGDASLACPCPSPRRVDALAVLAHRLIADATLIPHSSFPTPIPTPPSPTHPLSLRFILPHVSHTKFIHVSERFLMHLRIYAHATGVFRVFRRISSTAL
ncbi:hypothetical protein C8R47DRAFT_314846 [Mycena vitilis]|nr:hypothetical protein C8R47DRAFT_314846 [Mycena vitilis]